MSTREIEDYEQQIYNRLDTFDSPPPPPPPEPIYDLTTSDKTELVKAAGPIERGETPWTFTSIKARCDIEHEFWLSIPVTGSKIFLLTPSSKSIIWYYHHQKYGYIWRLQLANAAWCPYLFFNSFELLAHNMLRSTFLEPSWRRMNKPDMLFLSTLMWDVVASTPRHSPSNPILINNLSGPYYFIWFGIG
jgi:hypothetical protein